MRRTLGKISRRLERWLLARIERMNTATDGLVEYNGERITPEFRDELVAQKARWDAAAAKEAARYIPQSIPKSLDSKAEEHRDAVRRLTLEAWDAELSIYERELLPTNATPEEIAEIKAFCRGTRDPRAPAPAPYFPMTRAFSSQRSTG
jgi:hypothetical protein